MLDKPWWWVIWVDGSRGYATSNAPAEKGRCVLTMLANPACPVYASMYERSLSRKPARVFFRGIRHRCMIRDLGMCERVGLMWHKFKITECT